MTRPLLEIGKAIAFVAAVMVFSYFLARVFKG